MSHVFRATKRQRSREPRWKLQPIRVWDNSGVNEAEVTRIRANLLSLEKP